ncbi:MAG: GatB/YqeY domain-containing protein [Chthoniobacteraceae bacterium]
MDFLARIDHDLKEAMKAKQAGKLSVLRMLKSALVQVSLEPGRADAPLSGEEALAVVRKEMKKRQDAIEGFQKGGRPELAEKEKGEAEILGSYLPEPLSEAELAALVRESIRETGATSKAQMGAVIKLTVAKSEGRADGRAISTEAAKQLS